MTKTAAQPAAQAANGEQPQEQLAPPILPTAKSEPTLTAETAKVLLFGPPKIGKTTLAAELDPDHTIFLATEPGQGALSVFKSEIASWGAFLQAGRELHAGGHPYTTFVVDTVDQLHKFCTDHVLRQLGITHPSDADYGKGWAAVNDEFQLRIAALCSLGAGVWFISHAKDEQIKTRTGEITKAVPTIGGQARKFLTGFVDYIFYAEPINTDQGEHRVLRTTAGENFEAGGRVTLPDPLPLEAVAVREAMAAASPAKAAG